jgi:hypothetical protein
MSEIITAAVKFVSTLHTVLSFPVEGKGQRLVAYTPTGERFQIDIWTLTKVGEAKAAAIAQAALQAGKLVEVDTTGEGEAKNEEVYDAGDGGMAALHQMAGHTAANLPALVRDEAYQMAMKLLERGFDWGTFKDTVEGFAAGVGYDFGYEYTSKWLFYAGEKIKHAVETACYSKIG